MSEYTKVFERAGARYEAPSLSSEGLMRRRDRRRRNQRIAAGVVGIAVFAASIWIVTSGITLDRTGPAVTGPAVTGPAPENVFESVTPAVGPVPESDYLLDLNTGAMTPLPASIAGGEYAASPDGSRLAYTARGDEGGSQIFVANLDGTGVEQVTHDVEAAFSPAWSPDGSKIAFIGSHDGNLRDLFVLDLATGASTQLSFSTVEPDPAEPDWAPWRASLPSFTPDGSSVVYGASRGDNIDSVEVETRIVPVTGGDSVVVMHDRSDDGTAAFDEGRLSPDGTLLSYNCGGICVADADGTDERELAPSGADALNGGAWSPDGARLSYFAFHSQDVYILDVATGASMYVAEGGGSTWVNDHTLIVGMSKCYNRATSAWGGQGCMG